MRTFPSTETVVKTAVLLLALLSGACWKSDKILDARPELILARQKPVSTCTDYNPLKNVYFGDTHEHTAWSMDARSFGSARIAPMDAIRFARGETITHPLGMQVHIDRPLDFVALTDHAEFFDVIGMCVVDKKNPQYQYRSCKRMRDKPGYGLLLAAQMAFGAVPDLPLDKKATQRGREVLWREAVNLSNRNNHDCSFVTLNGYEWTGGTGSSDASRGNLHRNILYYGDKLPNEAYDARRFPHESDLWKALAANCKAPDCEAIAIPHNSNMSRAGAMWELRNAFEAQMRIRYEKIVEIYQHKGDSECSNLGLDPQDVDYDPACQFEKLTFRAIPDVGLSMNLEQKNDRRNMVRTALVEGLKYKKEHGFNPFELGIIASTDDHNSTPGQVSEATYVGHHGTFWEGSEEVRLLEARDRSPGGLAAIWAQANTRKALFESMQRREVYGTSGPRIKLRFYATSVSEDWCADPNFPARVASAAGSVPMGSIVHNNPVLVVWAQPDQTPLEQIQIVRFAANGSTRIVHLSASASVDAGGQKSYCGQWRESAAVTEGVGYYARVLEQPRPRWSWWSCQRMPELCQATPGEMIRERAWSSPIWFYPQTTKDKQP